MSKKKTQGLTVKKDQDFSEWYTQVIQKAELIEYSPVSGCYILRPRSFHIWERVQAFFNTLIKKEGVKNSYFPLFIPENLLQKEASHVEGFAPEVAWVETGGHTKLKERLAIRPTSETIMYDSFSKWIRSYKDLPLKLNQWANVVRWEFKHCTPFLRSREFLWQEGHTAFANKEDAVKEVHTILNFYKSIFEDLYAVPIFKGIKSEKEKFAGADFTLSVETFLPDGKAIQGATSHHLGQKFAKAFDIKYKDDQGNDQLVWQNSWGISTRSIGIMIMVHSDDKGLVLPPRIAETQIVIVPILFDESKKKEVLTATNKLAKSLSKDHSVHIDAREDYSPGWKFNEWELKGVPLRIEVGPRDLENNTVIVARRDTGEKQSLPISNLTKEVSLILDQMHNEMLAKARLFLQDSIVEANNLKEATKAFKKKKMVIAPWCGTPECELEFKNKSNGAKSLNSPLEGSEVSKDTKCFMCSSDATAKFYFGKSY